MNLKAQSVKKLLLLLGVLVALLLGFHQAKSQEVSEEPKYQCPPCGCAEDGKLHHKPGNCSSCGMRLVNVLNPSEGFNYQNVTLGQACNIIAANPDILLLDVRSEAEYTGRATQLRRFENAINIPITEIRERLDELEDYKYKEILVHCSISARSPRVSQLLADNGFTKVRNLMGGLRLWNQTDEAELPCKNELLIKPE